MPVTNKEAAQKDSPLVDVKVVGDNHTHAGEPVKKGAVIKVSAAAAAMLDKAWSKGVEAAK